MLLVDDRGLLSAYIQVHLVFESEDIRLAGFREPMRVASDFALCEDAASAQPQAAHGRSRNWNYKHVTLAVAG